MRAGTSLTGLGRYNENVVIHAFRRLGASSQRDVECSVFLGPWFLVVSGCVFAASQLVFDLVGGAVAER